jgi:DNA topoisomerase-1
VGNDEYARENHSFGLTTMRAGHADVHGDTVDLRFRGKGGKVVQIGLEDARIARVVRRCQDLPGQRLFQYLDEDGETHDVSSDDVNEYLRDITGEDFTAKDFRTWAGTVLAARALRDLAADDPRSGSKRLVAAAMKSVAGELGNTPAVCRRSYVHPAVVSAHLDGTLEAGLKGRGGRRSHPPYLTAHESAVLRLLRRRLSAGGRGRPPG